MFNCWTVNRGLRLYRKKKHLHIYSLWSCESKLCISRSYSAISRWTSLFRFKVTSKHRFNEKASAQALGGNPRRYLDFSSLPSRRCPCWLFQGEGCCDTPTNVVRGKFFFSPTPLLWNGKRLRTCLGLHGGVLHRERGNNSAVSTGPISTPPPPFWPFYCWPRTQRCILAWCKFAGF